MFSRISWAFWDLLSRISLSFTVVCIFLTLYWFLWEGVGYRVLIIRDFGSKSREFRFMYFFFVRKG